MFTLVLKLERSMDYIMWNLLVGENEVSGGLE